MNRFVIFIAVLLAVVLGWIANKQIVKPAEPAARDLQAYRVAHPTHLQRHGPPPKAWQDPTPLELPSGVKEVTYTSNALKLRTFQRLEKEGFFGSDPERSKVSLLVVGDLPSELIESWVFALNPRDVAERFVNWNYDAQDD